MVEQLNQMKDLYLAIGVGGISFLVLVIVLWFLLNSVVPLLNQIQKDGAVTQNVIINNTRAIDEMSKSNQNVATALKLLDKSMSGVQDDVQKITKLNEGMENMLLVVNEHLKDGTTKQCDCNNKGLCSKKEVIENE